MNPDDLLALVANGENSLRQFKRDITNADALAAELCAFANTAGGVLLIGVADGGELTGLTLADVARINQLLSNAASQHVRPPVNPVSRNVLIDKRVVMVILPYRGLGSGMPRAAAAWPNLDLVDDRQGNQFKAIVRRTPQVTPQVLQMLCVISGDMSRLELMRELGLKDRKSFAQTSLLPALNAGLIEMTQPDKPQSSKQRYRLSSIGLQTTAAHVNS